MFFTKYLNNKDFLEKIICTDKTVSGLFGMHASTSSVKLNVFNKQKMCCKVR